jgi:hypothetical protein
MQSFAPPETRSYSHSSPFRSLDSAFLWGETERGATSSVRPKARKAMSPTIRCVSSDSSSSLKCEDGSGSLRIWKSKTGSGGMILVRPFVVARLPNSALLRTSSSLSLGRRPLTAKVVRRA